MTAPTSHGIPTPRDFARRAAPSPATPPVTAEQQRERPTSAAGMVGPGQLRPNEILRQMYQQAIRISGMRPETRLVALTLLGFANFRTGLLNKYQPSSSELGDITGLTEDQAVVQLNILTQRGWLSQRRTTRGPRQNQLTYQLCIPQAVLIQLRSRRTTAVH